MVKKVVGLSKMVGTKKLAVVGLTPFSLKYSINILAYRSLGKNGVNPPPFRKRRLYRTPTHHPTVFNTIRQIIKQTDNYLLSQKIYPIK